MQSRTEPQKMTVSTMRKRRSSARDFMVMALLTSTRVTFSASVTPPTETDQVESSALQKKSNRNPEYGNYSAPWYNGERVRYSHALFQDIETKAFDAFIGAISTRRMEKSITSGERVTKWERKLNAGDFDELNTIFEETRIQLPPANVENIDLPWPLTSMDVSIKELVCHSISVSDINVDYNRISDQKVKFRIRVTDMNMNCDLNWSYTYDGGFVLGWISGSGTAQIVSLGNDIDIIFGFKSIDFDKHAPRESFQQYCNANIQIADTKFKGGISGAIANMFERTIKSTVSAEIQAVACQELSGLGSTTMSDFLLQISELFDQYLGDLPPGVGDPMEAQNSLVVPQGTRLLDFTDLSGGTIGNLFGSTLDQAFGFLGSVMDDTTGPTSETGGKDLGINVMMRSMLLDENRAYTIPITMVSDRGGILYQGHDKLTETTITMTSIRMLGLDSFGRFDPLTIIGAQTVQTQFKWKALQLEIDLTIDIRPSSKEESVIAGTSTPQVVEKIIVQFGMEDIETALSLFIPLDLDKLQDLKLGSILHTDRLLPCMITLMDQMKVTQLQVSSTNINPPSLDDFISDGIDRVVTTSVETVFEMYEAVMKAALPNFFNLKVRNVLNDGLDEYLRNTKLNASCAVTASGSQTDLIDFRDLFLESQEAMDAGASGNAPYGTAASQLMTAIHRRLLSPSPVDGRPLMNELLVDKLTRAQSSISGTLLFRQDLFGISSSALTAFGIDTADLRVYDSRVSNVDSVRYPLEFLQPRRDSAHVLDNAATIGSHPTPLRGTAKMSVGLLGDDLDSYNEVELTVEIGAMNASASVLAELIEESVLRFPLGDILNANCWLAAIHAGTSGDIFARPGLAVRELVLSVKTVALGVDCVSCGGGMKELPKIVSLLENSGTVIEIASRVIELVRSFVTGPYTQSWLSQILRLAPTKCPHSPLYNETEAVDTKQLFDVSALTLEGLELLMVSGAVAAQVATVIVVKSLPLYDVENHNPLSGQNALNVSSDIALLNMQDRGTTMGRWVPLLLDQMNAYLGGTLMSNSTNDTGDLGINRILRSFLLDDDGALTIPVDREFSVGGVALGIKTVHIFGLDTFTSMDDVDIVGPQTLRGGFKLDTIRIEVHLSVTIDPAFAQEEDEEDIIFRMQQQLLEQNNHTVVSIVMTDINVVAAVLMALNRDILAKTPLGALLNTGNILPCVLSAAHAVTIPELFVTVGGLELSVATNNALSANASSLVKQAFDAIYEEYGTAVMESIPSAVHWLVLPALNYMVASYIDKNAACPTFDGPSTEDAYVDFRDLFLTPERAVEMNASGDSPYGTLMGLIKERIGDHFLSPSLEDGTPKINELLIRPMTVSQSGEEGVFSARKDLMNSELDVRVAEFNSKVSLRISGARVENLDSVGYPLRVLEPSSSDPNILTNVAMVGVGPKPLRATANLLVALQGDDINMRNDMDLTLEMKDIKLFAALLARINEKALMEFPLEDILNANCWLATIPPPQLDKAGVRTDTEIAVTAALAQFNVSMGTLLLNVDCISCTSPELKSLSDRLSEDATAIINNAVNYVTDSLGSDYLQIQIDRMLVTAATKCPHRPSYGDTPPAYIGFETPSSADGESIERAVKIGIAAVGSLLLIAVIVMSIRCAVGRRRRWWIASSSEKEISLAGRQRAEDERREIALCRLTRSMATSPTIPFAVRALVPVVVLGNVVLFLSGHLNEGATVNVFVHIGGQDLVIENFFTFSMAKSTLDMWEAGAEELAVMILVFSGIWPYTKQIITLVLWFLPPTWITVGARGNVFLWLDCLAKWSMIDIFVLVMSLVAFRASIQNPDLFPQGFYSIELIVIPLWGLYANLIAQLVSQVSSHFIIYYHRRIVADGLLRYGRGEYLHDEIFEDSNLASDTGSGVMIEARSSHCCQEALRHHVFEPSYGHRENQRLKVRRGVSPVIMVCFVIIMVLVLFGCALPTFQMELLGLLGLAVESGQKFQAAVTEYSVFGIVTLIMDQARFLNTLNNYVGLGVLSSVFVLTIFAVPLMQCLLLMCIWWLPMARHLRERALVGNEILQAWQYVEVYILAVLITAWQIGGVSAFMINDFCGALDSTFSALTFYGILNEADAQCFYITAKIQGAAYALMVASALLMLLNHIVTKAAVQMRMEGDQSTFPTMSGSLENDDDSENEHVTSPRDKDVPVPMQFTDLYRYILQQNQCIERNNNGNEISSFTDI